MCSIFFRPYRINRIRLEFKERRIYISNGIFNVLIESDWNLKRKQRMMHRQRQIVLIESDWNLKSVSAIAVSETASVLIESDWNLKHILYQVDGDDNTY